MPFFSVADVLHQAVVALKKGWTHRDPIERAKLASALVERGIRIIVSERDREIAAEDLAEWSWAKLKEVVCGRTGARVLLDLEELLKRFGGPDVPEIMKRRGGKVISAGVAKAINLSKKGLAAAAGEAPVPEYA